MEHLAGKIVKEERERSINLILDIKGRSECFNHRTYPKRLQSSPALPMVRVPRRFSKSLIFRL
jgi:hypothetical protein